MISIPVGLFVILVMGSIFLLLMFIIGLFAIVRVNKDDKDVMDEYVKRYGTDEENKDGIIEESSQSDKQE